MLSLSTLQKYFPLAKNDLLQPVIVVGNLPNDILIRAHFLGQLAHESDSFKTLEEYASGKEYEGRQNLGNTSLGDGVKYKGRGYIQLTGKNNYMRASETLGLDFINQPEKLLIPDIAMRVSQWFWNKHHLDAWALQDDIITITKIINGGLNGLEHRKQMVRLFKKILSVKT